MVFDKEDLNELRDELEDWPRERLIMGAYGEMTNRERAVRVYVSLVLAVPFANLLMTSSPTAGRSVVALVSFGLAFAVGWRADYETLHVGDRADRGDGPPSSVDESYSSEGSLAEVGSEVEEGGSS